jgi:hypothetical protein
MKPPKGTPLCQTASIGAYFVGMQCPGYVRIKETGKELTAVPPRLRLYGETRSLNRSLPLSGKSDFLADVINCVTFCVDRLRGVCLAGSKLGISYTSNNGTAYNKVLCTTVHACDWNYTRFTISLSFS